MDSANININKEYCEAFCYAAKYKNFTAAAQALYISQPAVTYKIAKLEEAINCRLFDRSSRGVELTFEGELLYEACEPAFQQINDAIITLSELKSPHSGTIRVGVSSSVSEYLLKQYTAESFSPLYPEITVNINRMDDEFLKTSVQAGWIDCAVQTQVLLPPYKRQTVPEVRGLIRTDLGVIPDSIVAGSRYANLVNRILSVDELSRMPVILPAADSPWKALYMRQLRPGGDLRDSDIMVDGTQPRISLAQGNRGITAAPVLFSKKDIAAGTLVVLNTETVLACYEGSLFTSDQNRLSRAAERYVSLFLEQMNIPNEII